MDEDVVRAAEREMRRPAPDTGGSPNKRHKQEHSKAAGQATLQWLPRYDYAAPASLENGALGFLLHCGFQREKSAIREATALLRPYLQPYSSSNATPASAAGPPSVAHQQTDGCPESAVEATLAASADSSAATSEAPLPDPRIQPAQAAATDQASKAARAPPSSAADDLHDSGTAAAYDAGAGSDAAAKDAEHKMTSAAAASRSRPEQADDAGGTADVAAGQLTLAKLSCQGIALILLKAPATAGTANGGSAGDNPAAAAEQGMAGERDSAGGTSNSHVAATSPTNAVSAVLQDLAAGRSARPRHCQRIVPVEATCLLSEAELMVTAQQLAQDYAAAHAESATADGVTYAVAYKARGPGPCSSSSSHSTAANGAASAHPAGTETSTAEEHPKPLERQKAIVVLADAVAAGLSSIGPVKVNLTSPQVALLAEVVPAGGRLFCAMSLVGAADLVNKPRLGIRALTATAGTSTSAKAMTQNVSHSGQLLPGSAAFEAPGPECREAVAKEG